jgi:hypothetical protein
MRDLNHLVLSSAKNTNSWHAMKEDLQRAFPLDILMVPSSALSIAADGERLSRGDFSLDETLCFGCLDFIADYFSGLGLSPRRDGSDVAAMVSNHSRPLSPL